MLFVIVLAWGLMYGDKLFFNNQNFHNMEKAKKLSIEDLKKQQTSQNVVAGIDAIMGGVSEEYCHNGNGKQMEILQYMLKNAKI